jgi:hypothetical protein
MREVSGASVPPTSTVFRLEGSGRPRTPTQYIFSRSLALNTGSRKMILGERVESRVEISSRWFLNEHKKDVEGCGPMPHMKYLQMIGHIRDQFDDMVDLFERNDEFAPIFLESQGLQTSDKALIKEEIRVLDYLIGCQLGFAHEENIPKPSVEAANRCFNRHLAKLERVFGIHPYNANKYPDKNIIKQYKACRHYLFKFSLCGWYQDMPEVILSLQKYPYGE